MSSRSSKSWRRFRPIALKPLDKRVRKIEKATLRHAHTFLVSRWENIHLVRRHIVGWLFLVALLIGLTGLQMIFNVRSLSSPRPVAGGAYVEGMVGPLNTLNPLFAANSTEQSVGRLLFSSLLKYDDNGRLEGDLAASWKISSDGKKYILNLKPGLTWHDGRPLTAADVAFTVRTMQDRSTGARQSTSWQVIKVEAIKKNQVTFTLPAAYAPFASALTFPVLPEHILAKVSPEDLQENDFNKRPVGSGPFRYLSTHTIDISNGKSAVQLGAFDAYNGGPAASARFTVYVYGTAEDLVKGLQAQEINAASGVSNGMFNRLESNQFQELNPGLNSGVYALLRNDNPILKDLTVRQALVRATDLVALRKDFNLKALEGPIINSGLPQAKSVKQAGYDKKEANKLFATAGWKKNSEGYLEKDNQLLRLKVVAVEGGRYDIILDRLKDQWRQVGVEVEKQLVDSQQIQQTVLRPRAYDVLVYELELGGDPDGYAYWHSSQSVGAGLNLTGYSSKLADDALITGRSRSDTNVRDVRYATFARQWVKDAPAIALYRSTLSYVKKTNARSINSSENFVSASDRFTDVTTWTSRSGQVYNTP